MSQDAYLPNKIQVIKKNSLRGLEAKTTRSKDGTWAKKCVKSFFGYKTHTLVV
ncbi:MAG: hypothetical protein LBR15_10875 [Methanobrevibacter sp.]|jgi:hypothetical protein|nr:hypothetical protein [Candidatus Methanovirga australis]